MEPVKPVKVAASLIQPLRCPLLTGAPITVAAFIPGFAKSTTGEGVCELSDRLVSSLVAGIRLFHPFAVKSCAGIGASTTPADPRAAFSRCRFFAIERRWLAISATAAALALCAGLKPFAAVLRAALDPS
jgi:hypothetical protein